MVRALVVAPADVQPHLVAGHVGERAVDRGDVPLRASTKTSSGSSRNMMWRPIARSGASICSWKPASTIASYSTFIASASASRYSSSVP